MNWLMWIGGGLLFLKIVIGITSYIENGFQTEINFDSPFWANVICSIAVWIWICWRFI